MTLALAAAVVLAYVLLLAFVWALLYAHGRQNPIYPPQS